MLNLSVLSRLNKQCKLIRAKWALILVSVPWDNFLKGLLFEIF